SILYSPEYRTLVRYTELPVFDQGTARFYWRAKGDMADPRVNCVLEDFCSRTDLPAGFLDFLLPLHRDFTPRQRQLVRRRQGALEAAHRGDPPNHLAAGEAAGTGWRIEVPDWCADQRNQMTGPADDAELVVKMLNSGAPGVMLDLEDSTANTWANISRGIENVVAALSGDLRYFDAKRNRMVPITPSRTVIWIRPRGLHLSQAGLLRDRDELMAAALIDVALLFYRV